MIATEDEILSRDKDNQTNGGELKMNSSFADFFDFVCNFCFEFFEAADRPREVANSGKFEFFNHNWTHSRHFQNFKVGSR